MNLYVRRNIDIDNLCRGWEDNGFCYRLTDGMGEIIEVHKADRAIVNYGYTGLINDWYMMNFITDRKEDNSVIIFPHTIGRFTFYNSDELIEYVLKTQ